MSDTQSMYPDFNVLTHQGTWDEHTRDIVTKRVEPVSFSNLSQQQITTLLELCSILLSDRRDQILRYVVSHIDTQVGSPIGQSQRKKELPDVKFLILEGIRALDDHCTTNFKDVFSNLKEDQKSSVVRELFAGQAVFSMNGSLVPAKEFLNSILLEAVSAYYAHPTIWSEIGYAGPAYPRGYVRSERGLTDPWEAKRQDA